MKAAVIDAIGAIPRVIDRPDPSPATGNLVLVNVEAAALNTIDVHIASGHHRAGPPRVPYVPAIEAVGTIVSGPDAGLRVRAAGEVDVEGPLGDPRPGDHHVHADAGQPVLLGQSGARVEQRRACLQRAGSPSSVNHRPEYTPVGT